MSTLLLLLSFGAFIYLVLTWQRPCYVQNPSLQLLRVLFPSWKFFDGLEEEVVLSVREQGTASWRQLLKKPGFSPGHFFLAPQTGLFLAQGSLCEEFWDAWEEVQDDAHAMRALFESSTLAELLAALVLYESKKQGILPAQGLECCFHVRGVESAHRTSKVFRVIHEEGQNAQLICP